jgi:hypothetical protein
MISILRGHAENTARSEVLGAVDMKKVVFYDVASCKLLETYRRFGGTYASFFRVD